MTSNFDSIAEELPSFLKPTLRLFLSVDVVNSTAFKQANLFGQLKHEDSDAPPAERWFAPIAQFYRGMQFAFDKEWRRLKASGAWPDSLIPDEPELWRTLGDEIIYVVRLTHYVDALWYVEAWLRAIQNERANIVKQYPGLDLKGAAWVAGFPVNNAQVVLSKKPDGVEDVADGDPLLANLLLLERFSQANGGHEKFIDYIGPSIDTGFRVAKEATPRKFMLTVDLAYLIANALCSLKKSDEQHVNTHDFMYGGRAALKGVADGAPYPLFWLDMADSSVLHAAEDEILGRNAVKPVKVKDFCVQYLTDKHRGHVILPYIYPSGAVFGNTDQIPDRHLVRLKKLALYWKEEGRKRRTEQASMLTDTVPDREQSKVTGNEHLSELLKLLKQSQELTKRRKK